MFGLDDLWSSCLQHTFTLSPLVHFSVRQGLDPLGRSGLKEQLRRWSIPFQPQAER
jgi:hypothetical protein